MIDMIDQHYHSILFEMLVLKPTKTYCDLALCQELGFIEFYAGIGNVWRAVSASGCPSARVDLTYHSPEQPSLKRNPMDILSSAGFGLFGYDRLYHLCFDHLGLNCPRLIDKRHILQHRSIQHIHHYEWCSLHTLHSTVLFGKHKSLNVFCKRLTVGATFVQHVPSVLN